MRENLIKYENYRKHKEKFGHVGTWALWNEEAIAAGAKDIDKSYSIRKQLIIANSEEEYKEKGLDKLLNGDIVIMPLNFSSPKNKNDNALVSILNKYKSPELVQKI